MPAHLPSRTMSDPASSWQQVCRLCNMLYRDQDSWWRRILKDPELVVRVDQGSVALRLGGAEFLTIEPHGRGLHGRIAPEHLVRAHPGSRFVLTDTALLPEPQLIRSLDDLGAGYALVRRRVLARADRRQAVLDRLYLRHRVVVAVDAPVLSGRVDLVVVSPDGGCVLYLLRCYADADLRLIGPGGTADAIAALNVRLSETDAGRGEIQAMLDRVRTLDGPWAGRFSRLPDQLRIYPRVRLLIVDFDHAQRLSGLSDLLETLRKGVEKSLPGLDRTSGARDILAIGDPGNISFKLLFSGT